MIGRHSVMLSPDSVRRVMPPTTMIAKTSVEENMSQRPTAGGGRIGASELSVVADNGEEEVSSAASVVVEENRFEREERRESTETGWEGCPTKECRSMFEYRAEIIGRPKALGPVTSVLVDTRAFEQKDWSADLLHNAANIAKE